MEKLWEFTDNLGSFRSKELLRGAYFPLCNSRIMSSVNPYLAGDIKTGQDAFLLEPVSRINLHTSKASRNFWVRTVDGKAWSATGVSKDIRLQKYDKGFIEAGLFWHKLTRENRSIGIRSEILSFVPSAGEPVEIMQVTLSNISDNKIEFTPFAAIPMYCRGANNIRDHRHVTSLLQRIILNKFGVISKPTLSFDESGHKPNKNYYFVLGWDERQNAPQYLYPTQEMFCKDPGDLEAPEAIFEDKLPDKGNIQGKEPMGALRFRSINLAPGKARTYIVLMGIVENSPDIPAIVNKFRTIKKVRASLEDTKKYWVSKSQEPRSNGQEPDFSNWFRWVSIQPVLRKIFGCSFLPDFDYGKGGRGWRDLWQDCLGLILSGSKDVRGILLNNLSGVRIDGSNATIIGKKPGEFLADRNDIARVWMDHGVWPLLTIELYLNRSGEKEFLFDRAGYFSDQHIWRSRKLNRDYKPVKYKGTVLEHLLLQNLAQFYNVGCHNHIRLEGADWNDGLDMAKENGESVAFSSMYAANLKKLARLIRSSKRKNIKVFAEMKSLFAPCDYNSVKDKQNRLKRYFTSVEKGLSGRRIALDCASAAKDLEQKAEWCFRHIRRKEWLPAGFFNGYYGNKKKRIEGRVNGGIRMMLASQVFAIMSGTAEDWQVKKIISSVDKYLFDKRLKSYRLNTDFGTEQHDLGRAFSFSYGDKENGAIFSHMVVMYAYALISRGFVKEGKQALESLYHLAVNSERSRIYPCLPEYFNSEGRGMYSYLTGSASWFLFVCQNLKF